jgi:elongation factor Ts
LAISAALVKELRATTGAGILDCKEALQQADGDLDKAADILRKQGLAEAKKHLGREAREGLIEAYIHTGSRIGALVELNCETDFVARTPDFGQLAHDLAMQVVGYRPRYLTREDVPEEALEEQRAIYRAQAEREGKPPQVIDRIVEGRLDKFYEEVCLLEQPFIRDDDTKVGDVIAQKIAIIGENIVLRRFARFELGEA